jgi:hypothetical protein
MLDSDARAIAHATLVRAKDALLRKERLKSQLAKAESALRAERMRVETLEKSWNRDADDVKRLTGATVLALFTSLLGSKEQRLSKERRELAAAALKLEEGRESETRLDMECDRIADDIAGLETAEADYAAAFAAKEALLRDGETGARLAQLAEEEANDRERTRELGEAAAAGRLAEQHLAEAVESLSGASNWGTWDMLGGGWIATAIKHSKLDLAKDAAIRAQGALHRFRRELADVGEDLTGAIEIGGFSRFADYFFDGFIMDWMIQSKISAGLSRAQSALLDVQRLTGRLEAEVTTGRERAAARDRERRALIEKP